MLRGPLADFWAVTQLRGAEEENRGHCPLTLSRTDPLHKVPLSEPEQEPPDLRCLQPATDLSEEQLEKRGVLPSCYRPSLLAQVFPSTFGFILRPFNTGIAALPCRPPPTPACRTGGWLSAEGSRTTGSRMMSGWSWMMMVVATPCDGENQAALAAAPAHLDQVSTWPGGA